MFEMLLWITAWILVAFMCIVIMAACDNGELGPIFLSFGLTFCILAVMAVAYDLKHAKPKPNPSLCPSCSNVVMQVEAR